MGLAPIKIAGVRARVHGAAIDVLGPVSDPRTIHQSKFSMGFVLATDRRQGQRRDRRLHRGGAGGPGAARVQRAGRDGLRPRGRRRVSATLDRARGDRDRPAAGRITSRVDVPKGDPGNTLSREELEEKARRLAAFQGGASEEEMDRVIGRVWDLDREPDVRDLLPEA